MKRRESTRGFREERGSVEEHASLSLGPATYILSENGGHIGSNVRIDTYFWQVMKLNLVRPYSL